ncbi:thioredoxin domain-containing protein [Streptomyces chartreusis]|uniref:hypothetical protein n=1 Tax=Streptomyces chartreusis TaxID=1969 RepID=UPI00367F591D
MPLQVRRLEASVRSTLCIACRLGNIDDRKYKSSQVQMSQLDYRRDEPAESARNIRAFLSSVIDLHGGEHGYSDRELATVVGLHLPEFRAEFDAARGIRAV